jgi:site-specific recombinase XerD
MGSFASNTTKPPRTLTEREQRLLLKATGEHRDGYRDHVIYAMALATGLREHELVALDVGDVFDGDGRARRRVTLRVFKGSRDDGTSQEILLSDSVRAKLERFRIWKARKHESMGQTAPLFVSLRGTRLSTRQVRHGFAVWQERVGFDRHMSFHALRHAACSAVYRKSKDIRLTQRFARHKSILTTAIYSHPTDDDLARIVAELPC